jgi:hypothetical protein
LDDNTALILDSDASSEPSSQSAPESRGTGRGPKVPGDAAQGQNILAFTNLIQDDRSFKTEARIVPEEGLP